MYIADAFRYGVFQRARVRRVPADLHPPGTASLQPCVLLPLRQGSREPEQTLPHVQAGDPGGLSGAAAACRAGRAESGEGDNGGAAGGGTVERGVPVVLRGEEW